jgi:hypothetical protein
MPFSSATSIGLSDSDVDTPQERIEGAQREPHGLKRFPLVLRAIGESATAITWRSGPHRSPLSPPPHHANRGQPDLSRLAAPYPVLV